jgi:CheY-like chemotaxis protein
MAAQKGGIRVLLVDDHRMVRESIRRLLTSAQNIDVVGKLIMVQGYRFYWKAEPPGCRDGYQYAENGTD